MKQNQEKLYNRICFGKVFKTCKLFDVDRRKMNFSGWWLHKGNKICLVNY